MTGGITIVRDYVAGVRLHNQEVFILLSHRPGHAQVDFGEADGIIGGKLTVDRRPTGNPSKPQQDIGWKRFSSAICIEIGADPDPTQANRYTNFSMT